MANENNIQTIATSIEGIWLRFRNGETGCRNTLWEAYLPQVHAIAKIVYNKLFRKVGLDELVSSGTIGLLHAINAFDPRRGIKFETFCAMRIRGAMFDGVRSMDWVPRLVRSRHSQWSNAVQLLRTDTDQEPSVEAIATQLRMPLDKVEMIRSDWNHNTVFSLEQPVEGEKNGLTRLGDSLPSRCEDPPDNTLLRRELCDMIQQGLTRAERLVIMLYYGEGMTLREIGVTLDLSESRVSQMHSGLIYRIRAKIKAYDLPQTTPHDELEEPGVSVRKPRRVIHDGGVSGRFA